MLRRIAVTVALGALLLVPFAPGVTATHVEPEFGYGNPPCSGTKIDPAASGTYDLVGGGHVHIYVNSTSKGPTFDFDASSGIVVSAVTVKGGPNHNDYIYSPAVNSDEGLHSPVNSANNKYYGLSHLCFESAKKGHDKKK